MLSDADMHERMENGWRGGKPETVCGNGSLLAHTARIRAWLPELIKRHDIRSVCDAGAGDLHWVEQMTWRVDYKAFDLIVWRPDVAPLDITRDALPPCDAILCRMVLNHLDRERILLALGLFKQSARYLIATQFQAEDLPQRSPQFMRLDLRSAPYNLGEPLERVQDGVEAYCSLALWRL
jgi:hypothetical protein